MTTTFDQVSAMSALVYVGSWRSARIDCASTVSSVKTTHSGPVSQPSRTRPSGSARSVTEAQLTMHPITAESSRAARDHAEALDILACDYQMRPKGAPSFFDLEGSVRGVRREDGALVIDFDPAAA